MSKKLNWLLAGAATTLIAGAAVAQDAKKDDAPGERRIERRVIVHGAPGGEMRVMRMHGGSPEKRAEHLKTMLQLRPNQEAALKTYLEATKPGEHRMAKVEHKAGETVTTPERLDRMEKRMAEHQASMKKRHDATRAFYAQLDASQKKVFDAMPHMAGGHTRMAMMHRGGPMQFRHDMPHPPMPPMPPAPPAPRD